MTTHLLSYCIFKGASASSSFETRVETPAFPEPNQEWSAVLKVTFEDGRLIDSEVEQFVRSMPGGWPTTFSAQAVDRSQPDLAETLRRQADSWLRAKLADR